MPIERADAVVLPGVGAFGACMQALRAAGLEAATKAAATDGRPFLGICIGMQMLFDGSDETPDVAGLGVVPGRVTLLPRDRAPPADGLEHARRRPRVAAWAPTSRIRRGCTSSTPSPPSPTTTAVVAAWCDYGRRFAAAIEAGPVWATQFHPEKSGEVGMRMLDNFVDAVDAPVRR